MARLHIVRGQWREPRKLPKNVRTATIYRAHGVKVGGITGHACQQPLGEHVWTRQRQERIAAALPTDTFLEERRRTFHNDDAIEMLWQPNAITDGDSLVQFRRADVIVTGNIFTTTQYPLIDVANGGTVDGEINALNQILQRTVFEHQGQGGTLVVPGHGYLSDEHEVVEYRDLVVIVRDRIRALVRSGATLEQVKAARPTADYDTRYGAATGPWTTDMFVEAVYRTLGR